MKINLLQNIFWNTEQARIRAGYRLVLLIIAYIAVGAGLEFILGSLTNPIGFTIDAPLWFFPILAVVILVPGLLSVWLAGRFLDRRSFKEFGLHFNRQWWIDLIFGMGLGIILIAFIFLNQLAFGWVNIKDIFFVLHPKELFILPLFIFLFIFLCVGISEELVTRGYLLKNLAEGFNLKVIGPKGAIIIGWILSSVVFGLLHIDNNNATFLSTLNITIGGIFFGICFVLTGKLAIPIGLHITWNFFMANVFGFPVSGITIPSEVVTVLKITQSGPEIWTGGAFGPEGGLLCSLAILLGIILTLIWLRPQLKHNKEMLHLPLAYFNRPISKQQ
ncbi:MAG: CPBP family intramembrane metalloprotease [Ignavibacterium sp.]|nr:MAG: CPBP family intramembrane metalloprotease [Ignavibacterium sp.]